MAAIFVLAMVAVIIGFELLLPRRRKVPETTVATEAIGEGDLLARAGVFYAHGHTWLTLEQEGVLAVGADGFLLGLLGGADLLDLPKPGKEVRRGDLLFSIERSGRQVKVYSPVAGIVEARNSELTESPAIINLPRHGWAVRIRPHDFADDLSRLTIGSRARAWMSGEIIKLRDFFAGLARQPVAAGQFLTDGGIPVKGALAHLDDHSWNRFEEEFLTVN